jgi:zinc metalloprotease ZmpB
MVQEFNAGRNVDAYYHTDKFFRLMDGRGFSQSSFFGGTTFPSNIDHRGSNAGDPDGTEIKAHCLGNSGGNGIGNTTFMLADLGDTTNPIGIACDYRVVLHELAGHGVLYNHVSSANMNFSHSAGDGVAAILNDLGTQAADRFVTFPRVDIGRRHDRKPADG